MRALISFPRALARLGALAMFALPLAVVGVPAANAASATGPAVVHSAVTPMGTCHDADHHVCEQK